MLHFLTANSNWMADGTFKMAPQLFFQLYTIHAIRDNLVFPCLCALLGRKNRRTYEEMWRLIKMYAPNLNPRFCILDFELAAKSAIISAFPHIEVRGCFFHLSQSIWRKIQDLGLKVTYTDDEDTRLYCRMLASLAFLPPEKITEHFEELQENMRGTWINAWVSSMTTLRTIILEDSAEGVVGAQIPRGPLHVLLSSFGLYTTGTKSISRVQIINWKVVQRHAIHV